MLGESKPSPIGIRLHSSTLLKYFIRAVNTPFPPSSSSSDFSDSDKEEDNTMGSRPPAPRTLKDLTSPNIDQQPLCIQLNGTIELKPQLIHLLPKFRCLAGEDPNRHLQQLHHVMTSMKEATADADMAMMTAFPFPLINAAGEWFFCLPPRSITTWNGMKKLFLEKYFPTSKAAVIRKEICGIVQISGETLYEYCERYKKILASCPHHQISDQLIIQYFYEGFLSNERNLIDAASGGALTNKTIAEAASLLENMAANTQQFFTRDEPMVRKVNEVGNSSHLEHRMGNMEKTMQQIATAVIPSSYNEDVEQASVMYQNQQRPRYDPYSSTYNPGWRDHPNFSYANKQAVVSNPPFNQQGGYQFLQRPRQETQGTSIDDKLNLILNTLAQDNQKSEMDMKDIRTQMGQLSTTVSKLEAQASGKLPSQPLNHKKNANAIELRSGKQIEKPSTSPVSHEPDLEKEEGETAPKKADPVTNSNSKARVSTYATPPTFPSRFAKSNKETLYQEIWEIFKKIEVNIPLIDTIRQVPRYAKFLKELCTNKHKLTGDEVMSVGANASVYLQKKNHLS
ncbi:uncharacterized protein LOC113317090 [Papaver somniferum]|uniref:uncharacterized protein LOC113317090 n=1 Tax=Papaver somniferum TaxID=3469 RepID=UPI000E6F6E86|nr:uncharacterized protein LOC113317090 [Papaver somniferum]XP_026421016.1 uncharacterized protein LOC113317090 [Papaver somniferum]XP_026421017.1 uncharacterized protein LOC113317090 [Papaver somniferum]